MSKNEYFDFFENLEKSYDIAIPKYKKQHIDSELRLQVWLKYMGNVAYGNCMCCNINKIYLIGHQSKVFQAGHIVAESKGGPTTLENLRPICKTCNVRMATKNMITYQKEKFPNSLTISEDPINVNEFKFYEGSLENFIDYVNSTMKFSKDDDLLRFN